MDERHNLTFDSYEIGKLTLDCYLDRVIFYKPRSFSKRAFRDFMFAQSKPLPDAIGLFKCVAWRSGVKVAAISNEGRELTIHRIKEFGLGDFVQFFIASCFVHCRKPDEDIFRVALDAAQVAPEEAFYVDDRPLFVEVACGLGLRCHRHTTVETTRKALAAVGLAM